MKHTIDELFDTDPALAQWKRNFARADKMRRRRLTWERWRPAVIATVITAAALAAAASEILPILKEQK